MREFSSRTQPACQDDMAGKFFIASLINDLFTKIILLTPGHSPLVDERDDTAVG
jgi:hypothetical protein